MKIKQGLIVDKEVFRKLLEKEELFPEIIDIISEADSDEIKKEYLEKTVVLNLEEDTIYYKDTYEHKLLELVYKIDSESFKDKIIIKTKIGDVIPLSDISYNNKVVFSDLEAESSDKYELNLSNILPQYAHTSELVESIIKSFPDFNEYNLRRHVFKVDRQKPREDIFTELDTVLETPDQLSFLLLYYKFSKSNKVDEKSFKIIKDSDEISFKCGTYLLKNCPFVNGDFILDNKYDSLEKILKLSTGKPVFSCDGFDIALHPYFTNEFLIIPALKPTDLITTEDLQKQFLQTIYEIYSELQNPPKKIELSFKIVENKNVADLDKPFLFGFVPLNSVIDKEYSLQHEELPNFVYKWIETGESKNKVKFLNAIGVNTEDSMLVRLRKYLVNKISIKPKYDDLKTLKSKSVNQILDTLKWVSQQKIDNSNILEDSDIYLIYKEIFLLIKETTKFSILEITGIDLNGKFTFIVKEINNDSQIYYFTSNQKQQLISDKISNENLNNFFNEKDLNTIYIFETTYSEEVIKNINARKVKYEKILCVENEKMYFEEVKSTAYQSWRNDINNKFKIYEYKYLDDSQRLPYNIKINDFIIASKRENIIDISEEGYIYIIRSKENIPELLKNIINKNNFTVEVYNLFIEKWKNEPAEVDKLFNLEFEEFDEKTHSETEIFNEKYFPAGEVKSFKNKLIELLSLSKSPWVGNIYHFTHLENAVRIINSKKIESRNKATFKDSAGSSFISSTQNEVKNFARFYFRPLTPTQFYNEGLGKLTTYGDLPQCPVPIFFQFDLNEVLEKFEDKCFVSNGNLRHYPRTNIGNYYEFLKKFNFTELYSKFGECDQRIFLNASQQEFVVKDELDFSQLDNYKIICKDENDRISLLNLIIDDHFDINKIKVNEDFYHNKNPQVKFEHYLNKVKTEIYPKCTEGALKVISESITKNNPNRQIFKTEKQIEFECNSPTKLNVYYINTLTKIEWLVYTRNIKLIRKEDLNIFKNNSDLIDYIITLDDRFPVYFQTQIRHYKLLDHVLIVLNEFDNYFSDWNFETIISREKFKLFLVLHDIGKPIAYKNGNKENQYVVSLNIFNEIANQIEISIQEKDLFTALLSDDPMGKYFQNKITLSDCILLINSISNCNQLQIQNYFDILTIYYQVDTASYTKDAGGLKFLEHIFDYVNGKKVLEENKTKLKFSLQYEKKYNELKKALGL